MQHAEKVHAREIPELTMEQWEVIEGQVEARMLLNPENTEEEPTGTEVAQQNVDVVELTSPPFCAVGSRVVLVAALLRPRAEARKGVANRGIAVGSCDAYRDALRFRND